MEIYLITEGVCLAITEDGNKLWKLLCHNSFKKISFL